MTQEAKFKPVGIVQADEPVMAIILDNGVTLNARLIITSVWEAEGIKDQFGNPAIQATWSVVLSVEPTKKILPVRKDIN